jgi:hypothetical protein
MLPFGIRSAPKIFTAAANGLEWIMRQKRVSFVNHYFDNFFTIGPPASEVCGENLKRTMAVCTE